MKRSFSILLVVLLVALGASLASAAQYNVDVLGGGKVIANSTPFTNTELTTFFSATNAPSTTVQALNPGYAPWVSGSTPEALSGPLPGTTWVAAGWWQFNVNTSSGSDWNNVFGGGDWFFDMDWNGTLALPDGSIATMPTANFNATDTFDNVYGRWFKNNNNVWTYLGLYVEPNTGLASNQLAAPVGIFAFLANDSASFDLTLLTAATGQSARGTALLVTGGTGKITATPEPGSVLLLGTGLLGLASRMRRKKD